MAFDDTMIDEVWKKAPAMAEQDLTVWRKDMSVALGFSASIMAIQLFNMGGKLKTYHPAAITTLKICDRFITAIPLISKTQKHRHSTNSCRYE
jgi:hypothetical protein